MQKWPNERFVKTRAVSGFIFLRLLCPAILNPRSFNLISGKHEFYTDLSFKVFSGIFKTLNVNVISIYKNRKIQIQQQYALFSN